MSNKITRRGFLKYLGAAAISSQLPNTISTAQSTNIDDIIEKTDSIKIGNTEVKAKLYQNKGLDSDITYLNLHRNENVSVQAAKDTVKNQGGRLIYLEHPGQRYISFNLDGKEYEFDTNRIFTDKGIESTLKERGNYSTRAFSEVKKFQEWLLRTYELGKSKVIVAVHNNTNESYSIKWYMKGGKYEKDAKEVHQEKDKDADNFFFVSEKDSFDHLKSQGYNVALQADVPTDDGSLSVYWARKNKEKDTSPYINVEAQNSSDQLEEQKKMLLAIHRRYCDYSKRSK